MDTSQARRRQPEPDPTQQSRIRPERARTSSGAHPGGRIKHGILVQLLRMFLFTCWVIASCGAIHATQIIGAPLYFINRDYYYAYMAWTKQSFGILITTVTQWFSPTVVRVSGDASVVGQLRLTADGRLELDFPERLILIANHQLYTDWLYLWWAAYTAGMHGHLFILLKQSLRYIPVLGPGMMFYGFIFMARHWASDQSRIQHRLEKLKERHSGPLSGSQSLDPMWLLIFPEGTNLSGNTRKKSQAWAKKSGIEDLRHQLLPRSTGLQFCVKELKGTVDWVYDCTVAYEGIPQGGYGQDYFTIRSTYFQGRPPKSVNMYWRRFAISSIPVDEPKAFEAWVMKVWLEKEALLEYFTQNGRFPADQESMPEKEAKETSVVKARQTEGFIETEVKLKHRAEVGQIYAVLGGVVVAWSILGRIWRRLFRAPERQMA